jgi:uncharacterized protein (TIGR02466 family)
MNINEVFQSFVAVDLLGIDNSQIEKFCYHKIENEPSRISSPHQSNVKDEEKFTILKPLMDEIYKRLDFLKVKYDFRDDIKFKVTDIWINLNQPNAIAMPHKHPNHLFSGVYYVKATESGSIEFFNPIAEHQWVIDHSFIKSRNGFNSQYISVEPIAGKIIFFPSWMMHYVKPNIDELDRLSIAFNVDVIV